MSGEGMQSAPGQRRVLSVGQLTRQLKELIEGQFCDVWVAGEISNFRRAQSGHCYFTLKDSQAQMQAVVWKTAASSIRFDLQEGLEVIAHGRLDLWPPRGQHQLVIDRLEPQGMGALELRFRQLHARLSQQGCFAAERKRPLPAFIHRLAVVTSAQGAAVRDFLQIVRRRWRGAEIFIVPARVQGEGASLEIAAGIRRANALVPAVDCIVLTRGGGSAEDLWAFNEEPVVLAICGSHAPVVSAVGHEVDVTLSDLAADFRALTPSDAAARLFPSADDLRDALAQLRFRLSNGLRRHVVLTRRQWEYWANRRVFARPLDGLADWTLRLDALDERQRRAMEQTTGRMQRQLESAAGRLAALSPLAVLARGYSLTHRLADGVLVTSEEQVQPGDQLLIRLAQGSLVGRVELPPAGQNPPRNHDHA